MPREAKKACEKEKKAYQRVEAREKVCPEKPKRHAKKKKGHTGERMQRKKYALRGKKSMRKRKRAYQREQAREKVCPGKRNWQEKRCASQLREQIDKNFYHYIIKKDTRLKDHTICA